MKSFFGLAFLLLILFFSAFSQDNLVTLPQSAPKKQEGVSLEQGSGREVVMLLNQGKLEEAITLAEKEVLDGRKVSRVSISYANALFNLAILYRAKAAAMKKNLFNAPEADRNAIVKASYDYSKQIANLLQESVTVYDQTDARESGAALEAKNQLAWQLGYGLAIAPMSEVDRTRVDEAEKLYLDLLAVRDRKFSHSDQDTLKIVLSLADLYVKRSKFEEALPLYDRYTAALESSPVNRDRDWVSVLRTLAQIYEITGRHTEALEFAKRIGGMTKAPENIAEPTLDLSFRAIRFEKLKETTPSPFKKLADENIKSIMAGHGQTNATINVKRHTLSVRILIDENGNVIEAKADPGDDPIKDPKQYEELALRSTFRPFIYKDVKYKMRGVVLYQWFE